MVGTAVLLLSCSYRQQMFVSIGYYVSVAYEAAELQETPPTPHEVDKLVRTIHDDDPRVTSYQIVW